MKYLYSNIYWPINKEYNLDKLLYLMIDRPDKISEYNDFVWKNNKNQIHRDYDLPADVWHTGSLYWYKNDKCRRKNKAAYITFHGYKEYYTTDQLSKPNC